MPAHAPTTPNTPKGGAASAAPNPAAPNPIAHAVNATPTHHAAAPNPTTHTVTTTHDAAGNTTLRRPDPTSNQDNQKLTYDAWNRLVKIENDATGDDIAVYAYDGLGRRIVKRLDTTANGTIDASDDARHYYYASNWQVLEEASVTSGGPSGGDIDKRFIWGKRYIDDLIAREHDPDGDDTFTRHYALSDRQWNIVALAGDDGTIAERYRYTPYGQRTVMDQDFAVQTTGTAHDFWRGFQGLPHDEESGLVENRRRILDVLLGRFVQVDPLGYPDGMNRYAAYHVMYGGVDPLGRELYVSRAIGQSVEDYRKFLDDVERDLKELCDKVSVDKKNGEVSIGELVEGEDTPECCCFKEIIENKKFNRVSYADEEASVRWLNYEAGHLNDEGKPGRGTGSVILWDPNPDTEILKYRESLDDEWFIQPRWVTLYHEICGHSLPLNRGTHETPKSTDTDEMPSPEKYAVSITNELRKSRGMPTRNYYYKKGYVNKRGGKE